MKRFTALLLCLCLLPGLVSVASAEDHLTGFWKVKSMTLPGGGDVPFVTDIIEAFLGKVETETVSGAKLGLLFQDGIVWMMMMTDAIEDRLVGKSGLEAAETLFQLTINQNQEENAIYPMYIYSNDRISEPLTNKVIDYTRSGNTISFTMDLSILGKYDIVLEKVDSFGSGARAAAPTAAPTRAPTAVPATATPARAYEGMAYLRWSSGDWQTHAYTNDPLSTLDITPGINNGGGYCAIYGQGSYKVYLDFSLTQSGYSAGMGLCILTLEGSETRHPDWVITIDKVLLNGQETTLVGKPYTCTDVTGQHSQVHLYNPWYTEIPSNGRARGGMAGASNIPLSPDAGGMKYLRTIEVQFSYGPAY